MLSPPARSEEMVIFQVGLSQVGLSNADSVFLDSL